MCGTPVISFNTGVALDLIDDYKTGIKVELKNTDAFAGAIQWMYSLNEDERIKISGQCRTKAMGTCSKKASEEKLSQIIAEFVK
jgi:glycosyltransferase involved in cell wall biosynthesis